MPISLGTPLNFDTAQYTRGPDGKTVAATDYTSAYKQALLANQQVYAQALSGYQQILAAQEQRHQDLGRRYTALGEQVQGYLTGAEQGQMQRIADQYTALQGDTMQSAVNRGLGNFTVTDSLLRGVQADKTKAETDVAGQFGQMRAGYASQLGLAGLGFEAQAGTERDMMGKAGTDFVGSWRQQTPDPLAYAQLAQQQQQWKSANDLIPMGRYGNNQQGYYDPRHGRIIFAGYGS